MLVKRIFVVGLIFLMAMWISTYIYDQIKLHYYEQNFMHHSYQPLRGNQ